MKEPDINISDYKYMKKVVAMTTVFFAEDFQQLRRMEARKGDDTSQETGMCPRGQTRHEKGHEVAESIYSEALQQLCFDGSYWLYAKALV